MLKNKLIKLLLLILILIGAYKIFLSSQFIKVYADFIPIKNVKNDNDIVTSYFKMLPHKMKVYEKNTPIDIWLLEKIGIFTIVVKPKERIIDMKLLSLCFEYEGIQYKINKYKVKTYFNESNTIGYFAISDFPLPFINSKTLKLKYKIRIKLKEKIIEKEFEQSFKSQRIIKSGFKILVQ